MHPEDLLTLYSLKCFRSFVSDGVLSVLNCKRAKCLCVCWVSEKESKRERGVEVNWFGYDVWIR